MQFSRYFSSASFFSLNFIALIYFQAFEGLHYFFQRIVRIKIQVILRHHIPCIRNHFMNQLFISKDAPALHNPGNNRLKPEQLVAFTFIVK